MQSASELLIINGIIDIAKESISSRERILAEKEAQKTERIRIREEAEIMKMAIVRYDQRLQQAQKQDKKIQEKCLNTLDRLLNDDISEQTANICFKLLDSLKECPNVAALSQNERILINSINSMRQQYDNLIEYRDSIKYLE